MANKNLNAAKTAKKDKFYTQPEEPGITAAPFQLMAIVAIKAGVLYYLWDTGLI